MRKHRLVSYIILGVIIAAVLIAARYLLPGFDTEFIRNYIIALGSWSYVVFVFLVVISIPLPIPSTPIVLAGGFLYGTFLGSSLALVGNAFGASIAFFIIKKYGKPLLVKLVDKHHIQHFNKIFKSKGNLAALISFAIPLFPSDAVAMLLGLTKMRYHTFLFITIIGHIPRYLILNSLGEDLLVGFSIKTVIMLLAGLVFVLIAAYREKLKKLFFKELREVEREVGL
jgi:uncharacterized membrane protein YdjX (TVP38/TMEM64 family)